MDESCHWELVARMVPRFERKVSYALRHSGLDAVELRDAAIAELVERVRGGWLQHAPRVSREAQLMHLFGLCLQHAITRERRRLARLPACEPLTDCRDSSSAGHRGPELCVPSRGWNAEMRLEREAARREIHTALDRLQSAWRRLVAASYYAPFYLRADHVHAARTGLPRPPEQVWHDVARCRGQARLVTDPVAWRRALIDILLSPAGLEASQQPGFATRRDAFDQTLSRARSELRRILLATRVDRTPWMEAALS